MLRELFNPVPRRMPLEALSSQLDSQSQTVRLCASPRIREARFDDYPQIAALQSRYGFGSDSYEEWAHLWINNPLYRQLTGWPIGWVLEHNGILGYIGNIPLPYEFGGRRIIAATSRGWVVDASFRSYSFGLLSRFFAQKPVDLFLNTTVNAYANAGQQAFGASRIPTGTWDKSAFWITEYRGFASSLLAYKRLPNLKVFKLPLAFGLFLKDGVAKRTSELIGHNAAARFCSNFDDRFDVFWGKLRLFNSRVLLALRSREMLEWHFQRAATQGRAWILIIEDSAELAAYAIFLRRDLQKFNLKRVMLIDFEALEGKNELLVSMLSIALERCRRDGIHMLETVGFSSEKRRIIDRVAPHRRSLPSWLYFYKTRDEYLARVLKEPTFWDPSCFDGDAGL